MPMASRAVSGVSGSRTDGVVTMVSVAEPALPCFRSPMSSRPARHDHAARRSAKMNMLAAIASG
jgi:hypothetical protein